MKETMLFSRRFLNLRTLFLFAILTSVSSFTACRKTLIEPKVQQDAAADVITYALETQRMGMAAHMTLAAHLADSLSLSGCGYTLDTIMRHDRIMGEEVASYVDNHTLKLSCDGGSPESFNAKGSYNGFYTAQRMYSSNNGSWNWTVTDLSPSYSEYTCSGMFSRTGKHVSRIHKDSSFDVDLTLSFNHLKISKNSGQISGGKAVAIAECRLTGGELQQFGGDITFSNDGTASLLMKGPAYKIQLY